MREAIIPMVLTVFIVWVALSYSRKIAGVHVGLDDLKDSFSGIEHVIPPANNVSLALKDVDSADYVNLFCCVRFVLAPVHISLDTARYDTVLTIFGKSPTAAEVRLVVNNRKVLWSYLRSGHLIILTANKK